MISLLFFLVSSLGCVITANIIKNHPVKVVDIIHNNLPMIVAPYLSDILVLSQTIFTVTIIGQECLSEMFLIMSMVQFFRFICSFSTVLPPLKNYHDKYRLGGINGTGTEYIFSGHASYSALSVIYLYKYDIVSPFPLIIYNIISQSLIVLTRNHYTVDIVLAWIIVPLVYGNVSMCKSLESCNKYIYKLL